MRLRIRVVTLCVLTAGCGPEQKPPLPGLPGPATARAILPGSGPGGIEALRVAYLGFQQAKGRPPASFHELASYSLDASRPLPPDVAMLTVAWGAPIGPLCMDEKLRERVVTHRPNVDGSIQVMTADGQTGTMTAEEFRAARKATPGK